jgi:hypothetical protein
MSSSNGEPKIKFDPVTQWHLELLDRIKAGKKITAKMMQEVHPAWKRDVIEAVCLAKLKPKILYPWHKRWWKLVHEWWQGKDDE